MSRGRIGAIDWFHSLVAMAREGRATHRLVRRPRLEPDGHLLALLVDTSGSTLHGRGLASAKGVVAQLLRAAYVARQRMALVRFGGHGATVVAAPSRTPPQTRDLLNSLDAGGGTPLRAGLEAAARLLHLERKKHPGEQQTLVILTDGRSRDPLTDIELGCACVVVDTEQGRVRLHRSRRLAAALGARYVRLEDLPVP